MNAKTQALRGALEAVDRIVNRGGDADDVLRAVVAALGRLYEYAGIRFVEAGELVLGPATGERPAEPAAYDVTFNGGKVAALEAAPAEAGDEPFLARVALLVSPYCLVGWDTGGEAWEP
jgi:putative methionine-R-sulfoxide reductase with GAF domain